MIRLRSLGECVIDLGEVQVGPPSEVLFALLLYLIVERGHRVPRARLVELLWPEESDERARHNLRQAIYKAKQLGAAIGQEGGDVILPAAAASADYDVLLATPGEGSQPAIDLATVQFLPSYEGVISSAYAEWLDDQRAVIHSALRRHLVASIARARRLARWSEVEQLARRCLALDPMNEEAVIGLAEATAATGSRAMAVAMLERYLEELGPDSKLLGKTARELRRRIVEVQSGEPHPRAPFVGRWDELALLSERLDTAGCGESNAVLLWGAPGIGKSAILREITSLARVRGFAVVPVFAHCATQSQALATYATLVEGLLQMPGALGCSPEALEYCRLLSGRTTPEPTATDPSPTTLQASIQRSVVELTRAIVEEAPLLITIEDSQWADDASIERLAVLAEALRPERALMILTGRRVLSSRWPATLSHNLISVSIAGLPDAPAQELLVSRASGLSTPSHRYAAWCLRVAEGHPLYLRELGDRWQQHGESYEIPASLLSLLTARLEALNSEALRTLQFCALLGRESTLTRLEALAAVSLVDFTSIIEQLELADVAVTDGSAFVIRHELLGDVALARVPAGTRRMMHKRLAILFENELSTSRSGVRAWQCARHWLLAEEEERAAASVQVAASHLISIGLPGEAVSLLSEFLARAKNHSQPDEALALLIEAQRQSSRWTGILQSASSTLCQLTDGAQQHSRSELHYREASFRTGYLDRRRLLSQAEHCVVAEEADSQHHREAALQALVFATELLDQAAFGRVFTNVSLEHPLSAASDLDTLRIYLIHHTLRGDLDQAIRLAEHCIHLAEQIGNPVQIALSLRNAAIPLRMAARQLEALRCSQRSLALSRTADVPELIAASWNGLAMTHLSVGELVEARHAAEQAIAILPQLDTSYGIAMCRTTAASVALFAGANAELLIHAEELWLGQEEDTSRYSLDAIALRAVASCVCGETPIARQLVDRLRKAVETLPPWGGFDTAVAGLVLALRYLGESDEAILRLNRYSESRRERYPMPQLPPVPIAMETAP